MMKKVFLFVVIIISSMAFISCSQNNHQEDQIELLYSRSYENVHDFDEPVIYIDNYNDYLESGYPLDIDATFFETKILYTYAFVNPNLGTNIFIYDDFDIDELNNLFINCVPRGGTINVSPAFGPYAMIFAIDIELYDSVNQVYVNIRSNE